MKYAMIKNGVVNGYIDTSADHAAEITAAGEHVCVEVVDVPENGSTYAGGVFTPPVVDTAPVTVRKLTKLEYMNRFTDSELAAIYGAAKVSPAVEVWLKKFEMATPDADGKAIDLGDPRTIAGLQALEAATLLGAGRATEILA